LQSFGSETGAWTYCMEGGEIAQRVQELVKAGKSLEALEALEGALQPGETTMLSADLCELCNSVGMSFLNKGEMSTSLDLLKRAELLCEQRSNLHASVLNNLACYYRKLGKARTALVYLDKAREIEATAPSPKSVANTHLNYCAILSELGRHDEAFTHIMKAVIVLQEELMGAALGRERPADEKMEVLAVAYHNLAVELEFQKEVTATQYAEALSLYRKAADFAVEFLAEGNKVRTDLTRIYSDLQPQLTSYLAKGEKRKKAKGKSGSTAYLNDMKKRMSGDSGKPAGGKVASQKSAGVEESVAEDAKEEV